MLNKKLQCHHGVLLAALQIEGRRVGSIYMIEGAIESINICIKVMRCSRCGSERYIKAGKKGDRQRYECKDCGYHYRVEWRGRYSKEVRECAIKMVADGMGYRQVERALGVSNVTIIRWVRQYGESLIKAGKRLLEKQEKTYDIVEIDELCTYISKKKSKNGYGL